MEEEAAEEAAAATGGAAEQNAAEQNADNIAFIDSLPEDLRQEVLMTSEGAFLASLTLDMQMVSDGRLCMLGALGRLNVYYVIVFV